MSYDNYMYAVDRSDEYLEHYGIKGMKWGVRKAIASGNSKRLAKHYAKAQKKLAKLKKQADNTDKYSKRAKRLAAGAALAGGAAALGTTGVANVMRGAVPVGRNAMEKMGRLSDKILASNLPGSEAVSNAIERANESLRGKGHGARINDAAAAVDKWGNSRSITRGVDTKLHQIGNTIQARNHYKPGTLAAQAKSKVGTTAWKAGDAVNRANLSNNTIARIGAGAIGAGLAGAAGYNAYRAATAKKKAARFESEMNKAFAGTKYGRSKKRRRR